MKHLAAFNDLWDRYGWAPWMFVLITNLIGGSNPIFIAIAGVCFGYRFHSRFGSTLVGRKGERIVWRYRR